MKTTLHSSPARTAVLLAALAAQAATPAGADKVEVPMSAYQPLAFLVGHCWRGTFPAGRATDEHCFSWIYGGRFVRDEHVVHRAGRPDDFGESIYLWDSTSGQLQYLYIESAGGLAAVPCPVARRYSCSHPRPTPSTVRARPIAVAGSVRERMPTMWLPSSSRATAGCPHSACTWCG